MKIKEVKATITETRGTALVFNGTEVKEYLFSIKSSFKTEDGLEKAVRDYFKERDLPLVKIVTASRVKITYAVDIDTFMSYANEVSKETGLALYE